MPKRKKRKAASIKIVKVKMIPRPDELSPGSPYEILDRIVRDHHEPLHMAHIALVAMFEVKADKDGHLMLGKCKIASDLDREFSEYDIVIFLNSHAWGELTPAQRDALVDHELMHATPSLDPEGEIKLDSRGRVVYRLRDHDIQEFNDVVKRHGIYLSDLAEFCRTLKAAPLFVDETKANGTAHREPLKGIGVE